MTPSKPTPIPCSACGRVLDIRWPTRSLLCACGARVLTTTSPAPPADRKAS